MRVMATESDSCRAMIKDEADDGVRTRTYRRRWAMLAIFDGIALVNGLEWITFAPINSLAQTYYGVSASDINFLSTIFMILFLPGLVGSSLLTHRYGSRTMCITSSALSFGCALLRWVSTGSGQAGRPFGYTYALIGQVLGALAQPALLAMPARLASEWFPASQRNTATVVLSMANPIGIAVGQVLPSMIVPGPGTDGFPLLSLIVLVCASVSFVSSWFLWSKPPLPPSAAAAHRSAIHVHTDAPSIIVGHLRTMFSTKGFVALTVGFGIGLAVFNVILTVIEALIEPAGFKSDDAGIFGGIAILAGLVGSGIAGGVLDATQKYRALLRVFAVSSLVVVTATLTVLGLHPPYALACVMFALLGASMLPMLPLTLESAAECTYPVPEELSSGVQMLAGNVLGFVGVIVVQYLLGGRPVFLVYSAGECLIVAVMIVAASAMFVFDGPYLRQ